MAVALAPATMTDLDYLLSEVAESLQLDESQYDRMRASYEAVCRWLSASESPFGAYDSTMYAQGSTAIGTTVKPKRHDEFDLDFVFQVDGWRDSAMGLSGAVYDRLRANGAYSQKLQQMRRCVRIDYRGEFHLDIVPAVLIAQPSPTSIYITDTATGLWSPSNPKAYAQWFLKQARTRLLKAERKIEPLPRPLSVEGKEVLVLAVQLMKRRRDELFAMQVNEDSIPRSIVLTTLAAMYYQYEASAAEAVRNICMRVQTAIIAAQPRRIDVPNPTDSNENFAESFNKAPDAYTNLQGFVRTLRRDMDELLVPGLGIDAITKKLTQMFGDKPAGRAIEMFTERISKARNSGTLRSTSAGLSLFGQTSKGTPVPPSRFYGD
jgi:hypothetical protein